MKKISECNYNYRDPFIDPYSQFTETDYKLVNELFAVFQSIFPAFKQSWPTESDFERSKREWIKAFKLANLTNLDSIKMGVDKYRLLVTPFVPSPGQFISMCKPENSMVPPIYKALPPANADTNKQKNEIDKMSSILGIKLKCPSNPSPN